MWISLQMLYMTDLDVSRQIMSAFLQIELNWTDIRLTWDPQKYGGVDSLYIDSSLLWMPADVVGSSILTEPTNKDQTFPCILRSNGSLQYMLSVTVQLVCPMDISRFPFDSQTCGIGFVPSYEEHQFDPHGALFTKFGRDISVVGNGEWQIENVSMYEQVVGGGQQGLETTFVVGCFWSQNVRQEQLSKLSIALTSMMSMTTFVDMISQQMPKTSSFPLLGIFVLACVFITSISCVILVLFTEKPLSKEKKPAYDVSRQLMWAYAQIELNWTDPRLVWDPKKYGGVELFYVDSNLIWIPTDVVGSSIATEQANKDQIYPCILQANGSVGYVLSVSVQIVCAMDISKFPFDSQTCSLQFSASYDGNIFEPIGAMFTKFNRSMSVLGNGEWEIENVTLISFIAGGGVDGVKSPIEQLAKLSIALTSMMSMTTFVDMISQQMPKTASFPLLGIFVLVCVFITSTSLLVVFTEKIPAKEKRTPRENLMHFFISKHFGFFILFEGLNLLNFIIFLSFW
ncbi:unnamed protein product, partial [Mesorhabditis spiculigera]